MDNRNLATHLIPGPPPSMYYISNFITGSEEASLLKSTYAAPVPQWRQLSHRRLQSLPSPLSATNVLLDTPLPDWLRWPADRIRSLELPATADEDRDADAEQSARHLFSDSPHKGPNHCLVNEYQPGQGIMPHEDGPAYHPITATVSLGGHAVLVVGRKSDGADGQAGSPAQPGRGGREAVWRILCEPRSLLVTCGDAYVSTLHSIEEVEVDKDIGPPETRGVDQVRAVKQGVANWELLADQEVWVGSREGRQRQTRVSLTYRDVLKVRSLKAFGALPGSKKR